MSLSYNGQEWDSKTEINFLIFKAPFISHIEPAATVLNYSSFYPGDSAVTLFGKLEDLHAEIEPTAGPDSGGSRITVSGVFLQPKLGGHDLFCRCFDCESVAC